MATVSRPRSKRSTKPPADSLVEFEGFAVVHKGADGVWEIYDITAFEDQAYEWVVDANIDSKGRSQARVVPFSSSVKVGVV